MKISNLVKHIAQHEGKKSQVKIGDIREIVGIISDLVANEDYYFEDGFENYPSYKILLKNGRRRARAKIKKREK